MITKTVKLTQHEIETIIDALKHRSNQLTKTTIGFGFMYDEIIKKLNNNEKDYRNY